MKRYKWEFAVGTTSRVPGSNSHYFICDIDSLEIPELLKKFLSLSCDNVYHQRTPRGWHIYTDYEISFHPLCKLLRTLGADGNWIRIGQKRGYLFLKDYRPFNPRWPVERMVLKWQGEKAKGEPRRS